jgi:hypothetical protein
MTAQHSQTRAACLPSPQPGTSRNERTTHFATARTNRPHAPISRQLRDSSCCPSLLSNVLRRPGSQTDPDCLSRAPCRHCAQWGRAFMSDWPVERDPVFGCWLWTGRTYDGYGVTWRGRKPLKAYIEVYNAEVGDVPEGLHLEHECRRRLCVNPAHVTPVTPRENMLRKAWAYRARISRCRNGHSMSDAMVTPEGGRLCRTCAK